MKEIRASSIDRIWKCPKSAEHFDGVGVEIDTGETDFGRACHAVMQSIVERRLEYIPDCEHYADLYKVKAEDVYDACRSALLVWIPHVECPEVLTELHMRAESGMWSPILTCTSDVFMNYGDRIDIIDWKFGWKNWGHRGQAIWNMFCASRNYPNAKEISFTLVYGNTWETDTIIMRPDEIEDSVFAILGDIERSGDHYVIGSHCQYCDVRDHCPGFRESAKGTLMALSDDVSDAELNDMELEAIKDKLFAIAPQVKLLEQQIKRFTVLRNKCVDMFGPQQMSETTELARTEARYKKMHPTDDVKKYLRETFGDEKKFIKETIDHGAVFKAARAAAKRGKKKAAAENLEDELLMHGLMSLNVRPVYKERKIVHDKPELSDKPELPGPTPSE